MLVSFMVEFTVDITEDAFEDYEDLNESAVVEYVEDNWADLIDVAGEARYRDMTMIG